MNWQARWDGKAAQSSRMGLFVLLFVAASILGLAARPAGGATVQSDPSAQYGYDFDSHNVQLAIGSRGTPVVGGQAEVPPGRLSTSGPVGHVHESSRSLVAPRRVFTSTDPLVGDVANAIEARYPGHVIDVNVPVRRSDGSDLTDFDIELPNAIIQVKSGRGKGAAGQAMSTIDALATAGRPVIVYGPDLGPHVMRDIEARGGLVTRSLDELLDVIGP